MSTDKKVKNLDLSREIQIQNEKKKVSYQLDQKINVDRIFSFLNALISQEHHQKHHKNEDIP
jgi:hypothetical protein